MRWCKSLTIVSIVAIITAVPSLSYSSDSVDSAPRYGFSIGPMSGRPATDAETRGGFNEESGLGSSGRIFVNKRIRKKIWLTAGVDFISSVANRLSLGNKISTSVAGLLSIGVGVGGLNIPRQFYGSLSVGYGTFDVSDQGVPEDDLDGCAFCLDFTDYKQGYNGTGVGIRASLGRNITDVTRLELVYLKISGSTDELQAGSTSGLSAVQFMIGYSFR